MKLSSSKQWQKTRLFVLQRDGYRCQINLPGCTRDAPIRGGHMHHTVGRHTGLDPDYLVAACKHCNTSLGDPTRNDPPPQPRTQWKRS